MSLTYNPRTGEWEGNTGGVNLQELDGRLKARKAAKKAAMDAVKKAERKIAREKAHADGCDPSYVKAILRSLNSRDGKADLRDIYADVKDLFEVWNLDECPYFNDTIHNTIQRHCSDYANFQGAAGDATDLFEKVDEYEDDEDGFPVKRVVIGLRSEDWS